MTTAQPQPTREGELLAGRYTLSQRLGGGGVGEVYKARDERLKRDVAIKLLRQEHTRSRDVVQRLLREAQVTDQVRHPNVVEVFDVDVDPSGVPFLVQELLRGEDLADHVARRGGRLPPEEVLAYMVPVCDAVSAAHYAKVVHRDLKPENVFLMQSASGVIPKVLDFGLARVLLAPGQARLTATGLTMGTPYFMSPEQVQGDRNIDARSDVWALGVMLYEMLSGRLPFNGDSEGAVYVRVCTVEPTPIELLAPWINPDLALVVGRCLRKDPARRYPDASGLVRDLTHVQRHEAVEPTLTSSPLTTQMMRIAPVSITSPEPAMLSGTDRKNAPPTVQMAGGWSPSTAPTPPKRKNVWVLAAAVGVVLALSLALAAVLVFSRPDGDPDPSETPRPFTPTVRVVVPMVPQNPAQAPAQAPGLPVGPIAPAVNPPAVREPSGAHRQPDLAPKPRGQDGGVGIDPSMLPRGQHNGSPSENVPSPGLNGFPFPIENSGQ